jgi:protein SCO1
MKIPVFHMAILACALAIFAACERKPRSLPILGERRVVNNDTLYHAVPDFQFVDQDSAIVNNATFAGKVYVADFFFIHCPTICPRVTANMLRLHKYFQNDPRVMLLAHSIDTRNDTVAALKRHADKLGIDAKRWKLVTGDHDAIYSVADDYFSVAVEDPSAPGGFDHSGRLILVDTKRRVRSFCDGTDAADTERFIKDIELLLEEEFGAKQ